MKATDPISARIARRAAAEIADGSVVNLGIGIPLLIPDFLFPTAQVASFIRRADSSAWESPRPPAKRTRPHRCRRTARHLAWWGVLLLNTAVSFCIVRGGRLDCAVLGALEVDAEGNLANWIVPGKWSPGVGGGMELAQKARRVIVATRHTAKWRTKDFRALPLADHRAALRGHHRHRICRVPRPSRRSASRRARWRCAGRSGAGHDRHFVLRWSG